MPDPALVPNVLADRYASAQMRAVWSPEGRIRLERQFWLAVLKAQRELGREIPAEALLAYERVLQAVDLEDIRSREGTTKHDVKARIESFNAAAGYELIHQGMTSRDLTENVEQLQVRQSLEIVLARAGDLLRGIASRARELRDLPLVARTHNVPAQLTTAGKRLANVGEELLLAVQRLRELIARYPVRGLKGAVGTQVDQLSLLAGDTEKVAALDARVLAFLGFERGLSSVGQIYPRSLDFEVVSALHQLACGPANLCTTLRLMAGQELATEGFLPGQVGSSAMPHKMNARSCERVCGLKVVLGGYVAMAAELAGTQWNEGDVSCSVVRRVLLPDSFFAVDGLLRTAGVVVKQLEIFPGMVEQELARERPFLLTTTILMAALSKGLGREAAHGIIKEHALAALRERRTGEADGGGTFLERLAADARLPLDACELEALTADTQRLTGNAAAQVDAFVAKAEVVTAELPEPADDSGVML